MISNEEYDNFRTYLEEVTGIVLGENKHYLISSRLNRLMDEKQFSSYGELLATLKKAGNSQLQEQIIDAMTTNETMWFRDTFPFEILKQDLLPELAKTKKSALRIWSAACSSGQEPYSISMTVSEFLAKNPGAFPAGVKIVATDISPAMLNYCKQARYDSSAINRGMSEERKTRFFSKVDQCWEVKPEIRARVEFRSLNLQQNFSSLGSFDVIFCRNVLIYFSSEFKTDILTRMAAILGADGYLFLGVGVDLLLDLELLGPPEVVVVEAHQLL